MKVESAVGVGENAAQGYVDQPTTKATGKAVVACVNSPNSVTIAGDETAVQKVLDLPPRTASLHAVSKSKRATIRTI